MRRATYVVDCLTNDDGVTIVRAAAIEVGNPDIAFPPLLEASQLRPGLHSHPYEAATDALAEIMPEEWTLCADCGEHPCVATPNCAIAQRQEPA